MKSKPDIDLQTSIPLWMATGAGKSYTMGEFMNKLFKLRNRYKPDRPIKGLFLNNRISLVNQVHEDFFKWRDDKPWFLADHPIHTQVFHSKLDDIEKLKTELFNEEIFDRQSLLDYGWVRFLEKFGNSLMAKILKKPLVTITAKDLEDLSEKLWLPWVHTIGKTEYNTLEIEESGTWSKDEMYFSTFQTAYAQRLDEKIEDLDMIVIDEAHIIKWEKAYETLMRFYKPNKEWKLPLVFLLSATMNPVLHLINDPVVKFSLPEYIASAYCPKIHYNLVTTNEWTTGDIKHINEWITEISQMEDLSKKKKALKECKEYLETILKKSSMTDKDLVTDMIWRVGDLDYTIIFAKDIDSADAITAEINKQTWNSNTAIAIHSRIDEVDKDVLEKYNNGTHKVIVAVNKLNEGIDLPKTKNVIFWRETESDIIFQQQFGRWLRWDEVNIYDYVGGLRHLAWVNGIHRAVEQIHQWERMKQNWSTDDNENRNKVTQLQNENNIDLRINTTWLGSEAYKTTVWPSAPVDIQELMLRLQNEVYTLDMTDEEFIVYFRNKLQQEGITDNVSLKKYWVIKFSRKFWFKEIGRLLGRTVESITSDILEEMVAILWLEEWGNSNRELFIKEFKERLAEEAIIDKMSLLEYWATRFVKKFWRWDIGQLFGKLMQSVSLDDLTQLASLLWFEERDRASRDKFIKEFKEKLVKESITDRITLLDYWPTKFAQVFWRIELGKILGISIIHVSLPYLNQLADVLGFATYADSFKTKLAGENILDQVSLLDYWPKRFAQVFSTPEVGKLLGKTVNCITVDILKELADTLQLEEESKERRLQLIQEFAAKLMNKWVTNKMSLVNYWVIEFKRDFWLLEINKLLRKQITNTPKVKDLENLAEILWLENDYNKVFKEEIAQKGIIDRRTLLDYTAKKFGKDFWRSTIGKVLGRIVSIITVDTLTEIADTLWFEEIDYLQSLKTKLITAEAFDRRAVLSYSARDFVKQFWAEDIGEVLGRSIRNSFTAPDLKELADILGL